MEKGTRQLYFNGSIILIVTHENKDYVSLESLCKGVDMYYYGQRWKVINDKEKYNSIQKTINNNTMVLIPLNKVNTWFQSIHTNRIKDKKLEYLNHYKNNFLDSVTNEIAHSTTQSTTIIEDKDESLASLRNLAHLLVQKNYFKSYSDVWEVIHERFDIERINELNLAETIEAHSYLSSFNEDENNVKSSTFSDSELCRLAWLWRAGCVMFEAINQIRPSLRVLEHKLSGQYISIVQEYPRVLNESRSLLKRKTAHIEHQPWKDDNWSRVLPHLRGDKDT